MATNDNTSENDRLIRESARDQAELIINARTLTAELSDQLGLRSRLNAEDRALLSLSRSIAASAAESSTELRRAGHLAARITKERKLLAKVENELAVFRARQGREFAEIQKKAKDLLKIAKDHGMYSEEFTKATLELADAEVNRYVAMMLQQQVSEEILKQRKQELKFSDEVNKSLGIAGALLDNLDKLGVRFLGGIGLNLGIFQKGLRESKEAAVELSEGYASIAIKQKELTDQGLKGAALTSALNKQAREAGRDLLKDNKEYQKHQEKINELKDKGKNLTKEEKKELKKAIKDQRLLVDGEIKRVAQLGFFAKKRDVIKKLAPGVGDSLKEALTDPTTAAVFSIDAFIKAFSAVNKASVELSRYTGQTALATSTLNTRLATSSQILETIAEFTKQTGLNANNIFSDRNLQAAAEFKNTLGLSSEEAFGLAFQAEAFGRNIDATTNQIVDQVNTFNRSNRAAVSQGQILRDVAKASDAISASLSGNPKALADAAAAARRLGLELNQIDQIASSLLDFESSIEAELSAQLITGRNINLSKARELALSNDLAGVGKEIFKNSVDIAEFGRMGRIEQESMAQALGMTRDQLARTAYLRAIEKGMTEEQAAAAANVRKEDMERLALQESLNMSLEKIAQTLAGPAELLASMASHAAILNTVLGVALGSKVGALTKQLLRSAKAAGILATMSMTTASAISLGVGAVAVVAGIAAMSAAARRAKEDVEGDIDDGIVQNGKVITTHPEDFLIATKDPRGLANAVGGTADLSPLTRKIDELIRATRESGAVYIDSNKLMQVANTSGVSNYS